MSLFAEPETQAYHSIPSEEQFEATKVFPLIHAITNDVVKNIDSSLSWEQLTASDINFTIVRPLVFKYARLRNLATVHVCMVVRGHFLSLSRQNLAHASLNNSRSMMCELLAMKLLRHFAGDNIELVAVLTHSWNPLAGAPRRVVEEVKNVTNADDDDLAEPMSALEMAISTNAKTFLASSLVQSVINDIYSGRIVYSTVSRHSLLADNYKQRQIEIYDYRQASFLNHYRLRVPKYGMILEMMNFGLLLLFFMLCLANKDLAKVTSYELVFGVFFLAFILEEYTASQEHGWRIYMANIWNVFDTSFIVVWLIYLAFRIKGLTQKNVWSNDMAFDILACGACILFPRIAFFAVSNSVVILSLRAMIADFFYFIAIAAICFSGLLFTLWELVQLEPGNTWTLGGIAWLMTQIWFGNPSLSFSQAASFHPIFGPILMVLYAALSNSLLLTILVSILTNTFARIDANATEEHLFQFTVTTLEGVKSDALFSYQPPFNLLAYIILAPLSYFVSPRTLHSANVLLIRITSFPILIVIAIYERYITSPYVPADSVHALINSFPRPLKTVSFLDAIVRSSSVDVYDAIFDVEVPPMDVFGEEDDIVIDENVPLGKSPQWQRPRLYSSSTPPNRSPSSLGARSQSRPHLESEGPQDSPLARIFVRRPSDVGRAASAENLESVMEGLRKVERALEGVMAQHAEMKQVQERQARIESLLMTLTRGMRGETGVHRKTST